MAERSSSTKKLNPFQKAKKGGRATICLLFLLILVKNSYSGKISHRSPKNPKNI